MNHYPRHIGDYLKDTSHLSLLEHGVYTRLLDVYYTREAPIPPEQAERLVGARTREEKAALQAILSEFFIPSPEGWRQSRADREIADYLEGADEREQKNAHEAERMRRFRERRKEMFATLRERGIVPKWDTAMDELQRLLSANSNAPETRTGNEHEREQVPNGNADATANQNQNQNQERGASLTLPEKRARKKPATACPSDFTVTADMFDWAESKGFNEAQTLLQTELFLTKHKALGSAFSDWGAAWRSWLLKAVEFRRTA